ncbi:hypothetical protein EUTSA_v10022955mg [Eutrema salsugineum]|uniref:Uncharacterized protein n=1 Tax=Eutrema salsugineum TaxID=72664 RepID=V4LJA7_EUTSA|nr:hypothetical protein EUTSA_v10022955mg [Eutrema salsugineum]ESQ50605.1 hypothetical protein EUTSA_v10022955mg [Eutrema salsugineum]
MAGQKQILNKKNLLWYGEEIARGDYYFFPGFSSPRVRVLLSLFRLPSIALLLFIHHKITYHHHLKT